MFVLRVCVFYVPVVKMFAIALDRVVLHFPWIALLFFFRRCQRQPYPDPHTRQRTRNEPNKLAKKTNRINFCHRRTITTEITLKHVFSPHPLVPGHLLIEALLSCLIYFQEAQRFKNSLGIFCFVHHPRFYTPFLLLDTADKTGIN